MKIFKFLLLLPIIALLVGCGGKTADNTNPTRFGTGGTGGMYYHYGTELAKLIQSDGKGYKLDVKTTAGAAANLRLLREKFLDIAIVQSDTLSNAVNGTGIFTEIGPGVGYAAVAGLYTEACQIVVSANSEIKTVNDLVGKKVSVGEKESGVIQNAEQILMAHGLTFEMIEPSYLSFADSAKALESGKIDAFFVTNKRSRHAQRNSSAVNRSRHSKQHDETLQRLHALHNSRQHLSRSNGRNFDNRR